MNASQSTFRSEDEGTGKTTGQKDRKLKCDGPKLSEAPENQDLTISQLLHVAQPKGKEVKGLTTDCIE